MKVELEITEKKTVEVEVNLPYYSRMGYNVFFKVTSENGYIEVCRDQYQRSINYYTGFLKYRPFQNTVEIPEEEFNAVYAEILEGFIPEQESKIERNNLNELKKALYKEKPTAYRQEIKVEGHGAPTTHRYTCMLSGKVEVIFVVPESDMGDAKFEPEMPAHLLIRWIK